MIFTKHHYTNPEGYKVDVYWYEDRYRYTVSADNGDIEYRELGPDATGLIETIPDLNTLEVFLNHDRLRFPYEYNQLKAKCIRCSKPFGAPRKEYNLAPICNRCFNAMNSNYESGTVFYEINPDGSKGNVIKD